MKKVFLSDTSSSIFSYWRWENAEQLDKEKMKATISYLFSLGIFVFNISLIYGSMKAQKSINQ